MRQLAHAVVFEYHDAIEPLPGSTPVRQKLVKDALVYLDKLSHETSDASLQRELVEAYVKIGNVQGNSYFPNLGDSAAALASVRKAVAAGERLVARDASGLNQRALALAYCSEADILYGLNDLGGARRTVSKSVSLTESAVRKLPPDLDTRRQLANTLRNWGDLAGGEGISNMGKPGAALTRYRRSLEIANALAKEYPDSPLVKKEIYSSRLALSDAETTAGHHEAAEDEARGALRMIQEISAAHPGSAIEQAELANMSTRLAQILIENAKPKEAVPFVLSAASIMETQVKSDPANQLYRRNLAVTELHVLNALRKSGDAAGALAHGKRALELSQALSAADPSNIEIISDVANSHLKIAQVLSDSHDFSAALGHAVKSMSLLDGLPPHADDSNLTRYASGPHSRRGLSSWAWTGGCGLTHYRQASKAAALIAVGGQVSIRTDLARAQTGAADAESMLARWNEALEDYRASQNTWAELGKLNAIAPEDAGQPERVAGAISRCRGKIGGVAAQH